MAASGRSRRAWGWHRLSDEWAARVVAAAGVRPGELVFDIGAGQGALTACLLRAGAHVVAVELHPRRADLLRQRFPGLTVVQADASEMRWPGRPFRVVANPPYGISSSLLRLLLGPGSRLAAADLVLQRARGTPVRVRPGARLHPGRRPDLAAARVPAPAPGRLGRAGYPPSAVAGTAVSPASGPGNWTV